MYTNLKFMQKNPFTPVHFAVKNIPPVVLKPQPIACSIRHIFLIRRKSQLVKCPVNLLDYLMLFTCCQLRAIIIIARNYLDLALLCIPGCTSQEQKKEHITYLSHLFTRVSS